jgi:hypothetical protein
MFLLIRTETSSIVVVLRQAARRAEMAEKTVVMKREWQEYVEQNAAVNKSACMRYLQEKGMGTADIARVMGCRYQHVRNVLQGGGSGKMGAFKLVIED